MATTTDRWRLVVREQDGFAHVNLVAGTGVVVGAISIRYAEYVELVRRVSRVLLEETNRVVAASLGPMIWSEARLGSECSEEVALRRLQDLGFTQDTWDRHASVIAQEVVRAMLTHMPEQR